MTEQELSAVAPALAGEGLKPVAAPLTIRSRALVALYAFVPVCALLIAADELWWGHALQRHLPATPNALIGFTAVFVLPHILASLFTFADREYLVAYRRPLVISVGAIAALMIGLRAIDPSLLGIVFWASTLWHVLAQQTGIARALIRPSALLTAWRWTAVLAFTLGGVGLFYPALVWPSLGFLGLSTVLGGVVAVRAPTSNGALYVAGTQALTVLTAACGLTGYMFFAVLLPRVVHDITGFFFYVAHAHNRNREQRHNWLYAGLAFLPVPIVVLALALPIGVNIALELSKLNLETLIVALNFFHYATESFMWKRSAPHRQVVPIAA